MPIPDLTIFREFLSLLTFVRPADEANYGTLEVIPARFHWDGSQHTESPAVTLWYPLDTKLTPENVVRRICQELSDRNHLSSSEVGRTLLTTVALGGVAKQEVIESLNALLECIGNADCSQFLISPFPTHPEFSSFNLGKFTIGPLNRDRLVYRSRKVKCDFFDRYPNEFHGRFALERDPGTEFVADFAAYALNHPWHDLGMAKEVIDYYFELVTADLLRRFRLEFLALQEPLVAAGAPMMRVDDPRSWAGSTFIAIFQDIGRSGAGYFCPVGQSIAIDFARADRRIPEKSAELKSKYGFSELSDNEIHTSLRNYSRFITRAVMYREEGRVDEAFLHYVIALDLLFGQKESSTQSVARRAAVISSGGVPQRYQETLELVRALYDDRSRYVHEGIEISPNRIDKVEPIVNCVLHCLFRYQSIPDNWHAGAFGRWVKSLDFIAAAIDAGKAVEQKDLRECAIESIEN